MSDTEQMQDFIPFLTLFSKQSKTCSDFPLPRAISSAVGVPPVLWGILVTPLTAWLTLPLGLRAKLWALGLTLGSLCCPSSSECHPSFLIPLAPENWYSGISKQGVPKAKEATGLGPPTAAVSILSQQVASLSQRKKKKVRNAKRHGSAFIWWRALYRELASGSIALCRRPLPGFSRASGKSTPHFSRGRTPVCCLGQAADTKVWHWRIRRHAF